LYVEVPSPRTLRLLNLTYNQIRSRIDQKTFDLDTSGGSRHPQAGRTVPFLSAAPSVLALRGHRSDLRGTLAPQFRRVNTEMKHSLGYSYGNMYRALGLNVATALQAAAPRRSR
jgi:hypothetical protein